MQKIPNDPIMLLSFVNTQLRDKCPTLDDFCLEYNVDRSGLVAKLAAADYQYDAEKNRFL